MAEFLDENEVLASEEETGAAVGGDGDISLETGEDPVSQSIPKSFLSS